METTSETKTHDVFSITTEDFHAQVVEDPSPILLDFWAPWCGPCRLMKPQLEMAAKLLGPEVRVAQINVDEEPELAGMFGISGIPTLALLKDRTVIGAWSGLMPANELVQRVRAALAKASPAA